MTNTRFYLDYNASTPVLYEAQQALCSSCSIFGNPSSVHYEGQQARILLQKARGQIAQFLGGEERNLFFTSGATEAAATLLNPFYQMGKKIVTMSQLYVGATEHACVLSGGRFPPQQVQYIAVDEEGKICQKALENLLQQHDKSQGLPLVAVQLANSETGVIQDLQPLEAIIRQYGGFLLVDATQYIGKLPFDIQKIAGDFFFFSAHKMGGVKGVGAIYARSGLWAPLPLLSGGGQEEGRRAGTPALPLICAFACAAEIVQKQVQQESERLAKLQKLLEKGLKQMCPSLFIYGEKTQRLPNTTLFSIPEKDAQTLQIFLDLAGFSVSTGAACSSGKLQKSSVLKAMQGEGAHTALRVSTGLSTTVEVIDAFLAALRDYCDKN